MRFVLGLLRFCAVAFFFCAVILPPVKLPGSVSIDMGVAWADDDDGGDDDGADDDDDDGGGSAPDPGSSGSGSSGSGSSGSGSSGSGSFGPGSSAGGSSGAGSPSVGPSSAVSLNAGSAVAGWLLLEPSAPSPRRGSGWTSDARAAVQRSETWHALNRDDSLTSVRSGSWNRPVRAHAVRGDLLALNIGQDETQDLAQAGFRLAERSTFDALGLVTSRFRIPVGRDIAAAMRLARAHAPRAILAPNYVYESAGRPVMNPCQDDGCYGPTLIGWESITDSCGVGIRIGMTDTAIDRDHPALRGRALRTRTFDPYGDGSAPDHGTAVAGLLVGNADTGFPGMLPGAELFAADVFHTNESGDSYSTLLSLVQGLDWLVDSGVSVVNVSMTGPSNELLEETVARLNERGVVVVAAAGNGGPTAPPAFPAAYDDVVSVTAVDQDLRPYRMANRGAYISFSSPGVHIWSAGVSGSGQHRTGTSFAAAHASAIIADVIGKGGAAGVHDALRALQNTAQDLGAPGKDPVFGWGLIHGTPACRT